VDRPSGRPSDPAFGRPAGPPPAEPRQRWRITFGREAVASDRVGRVALDEWQRSLVASGLPAVEAAGRARFAVAAPLPAAARGEAELIEIWLAERTAGWLVREALAPHLPDGHRWVAAEDVWLGAPPIVGQVSAADWRIELGAETGIDRERLSAAASTLNGARTISRVRTKGTTEKRYDLRPLLAGIDLEPPGADGAGPVLVARTRFHPELGAGRPDEVVAALAEASGSTIEIRSMTRVRLLLADDPDLRGSSRGQPVPTATRPTPPANRRN